MDGLVTAYPMERGARVLLAEDDAMLQSLVTCVLEGLRGWRVSAVAAAPEVMTAVKDVRPRLLLLDYRLQRGTAEDVLAALRADDSSGRLPVIVMTGERDPLVAERFVSEGAIGVIHKPFDVSTLAEQIEALLAASRVRE